MTLHEHKHGIVCMQGETVIAKARPLGGALKGYWQLKLHNGSWLACKPARPSMRHLQVVKGKRKALQEMRAICRA